MYSTIQSPFSIPYIVFLQMIYQISHVIMMIKITALVKYQCDTAHYSLFDDVAGINEN